MLPKLVILAAAVTLGAVARPGGALPRWLLMVLGAAATMLVISVVAAGAPWAQVWGRWPRYEGLVALPVYVGAIWLGARLLGPRHRASTFGPLLRASSVVGILLGLVSIAEAAGLRPIPSDAARPGSLTGSATDQGILGATIASVLVITVLRLWGRRAREGWAIVTYGGFTLAVASVVVSASRAGLVALVAGVVTALAIQWRRGGARDAATGPTRRFLLAGGGGILVAFAAATLLVPFTRARIFGSAEFAAPGLSDRPLIWRQAWRLVADRPVLGWGPSGFVDSVPGRLDSEWYATVGRGVVLDSPHSGYLQLILAGGVPLALIVVVGLAIAGRSLARTLARPASEPETGASVDRDLVTAASAALAVILVGLVTSFTSVSIIAIPALLVGGALAVPAGAGGTEPRKSRRARRSVAATLALWTLGLAVATSAELALSSAEQAAARGDVPAALDALDVARSLRPWDADVTLIGAEMLAAAANRGVTSAAAPGAEWSRDALGSVPDSVEAEMALAVSLTASSGEGRVQDLADAEAVLRDLANRLPFDAIPRHRLGGVLLLEGKPAEAVAVLEEAATLDPTNGDILATLAFAYRAAGDDDAARSAQVRADALGAL